VFDARKARPSPDRGKTHHEYHQQGAAAAGTTLVFLSSLDASLRTQKLKANIAGAKALGVAFAEKAKAAGLSAVVFDRSGAPYHGKVKSFADAAREGGLKF
jgi:large subunit ribosomal protein L18